MLLLFVLQFYHLQEIGAQKNRAESTHVFNRITQWKKIHFHCGPSRNSWIGAVLGGRRERQDYNPIF